MTLATAESPRLRAARVLLFRGDDGGAPVSRNNEGFNKPDYTAVKRIIAEVDIAGTASSQQEWMLGRILAKYHRQLGEIGLPLDGLDAVAEETWATLLPPRAGPATNLVRLPTRSTIAEIENAGPRPAPSIEIPPMESILGPGGVIATSLPGYESRPSQIQLAQAIADSIVGDESILAEAGTGTGKSLAYLIPAIYSGHKTIVSTEGKALQDQLFQKDLPFLQSVLPTPFSFSVLKGLSNYVCLEKLSSGEATQVGMFEGSATADEMAPINAWLQTTEIGDLAELSFPISGELRQRITTSTDECEGLDCPMYGKCFAMRAREAAKRSDIVVVNHTLLSLDLAVRAATSDGVTILPDRDLIVVDEAHALEDVATKAFTTEITTGSIPRLLRGKLPGRANLDQVTVQDLHEESAAFFSYLGRDDRQTFPVEPTPALTLMAQRIRRKLQGVATTVKRASFDEADSVWTKRLERYAKRIEDLADLFAIVDEREEIAPGLEAEMVLYVEKTLSKGQKPIVALKAAPISVAGLLQDALWDKWPVIATSATLSTGGTFKYIRGRVGTPSDAREISVESPFDFRANALIYLPQASAQFDPSKFYQDGSIEYFDRLSSEIEQLLLASDGRAFCLFTSRRALDAVYERIAHRLRWQVLKQGDLGTQETVRRFKEDGHAVLFGLRTFMTGVDVQGEALSLVIIDKLPFPTPDEPVYAARCESLNRDRSDKWAWFNGLAIPMATMTLKQAAGRLIRTKTDRGVIALMDGRLTLKSYGTTILKSLPPARQARSIEAVKAFFEG